MQRLNRTFATAALLTVLAGCGGERSPEQLPSASDSDRVPLTTASASARAAYIEARDRYEALHYAEAAAGFQKAVELDPDFAMAHLMRATTTESAEQFYASLGNAERSMVNASAGEQIIIRSFLAASQNDLQAQYSLLRKLEALYRYDERVHMRLGNYHVRQQEFEKAAKHFRMAIDINEGFAPAWNMLGYAYRGIDDFDRAKEAFRRYVELVPGESNPFDSYAELLMEYGDYDESIANYQRAIDISPGFPSSWVGLVINHSLKGEHERAVSTALSMLEQADNSPFRQMALIRLSGAHLHAGDRAAALSALDRLAAYGEETSKLPVVAVARELAADILLVDGEADAALNLYQGALELRRAAPISDSAKVQAKRQFLYKSTLAALQAGRDRIAGEYLAQYRQEARNGNRLERHRIAELEGYSALLDEDYEGAVLHLARANQMQPVVHYFAAVAYEGLGDAENARQHAHTAAYRNTLALSLPYFRAEALEMLERLDAVAQSADST